MNLVVQPYRGQSPSIFVQIEIGPPPPPQTGFETEAKVASLQWIKMVRINILTWMRRWVLCIQEVLTKLTRLTCYQHSYPFQMNKQTNPCLWTHNTKTGYKLFHWTNRPAHVFQHTTQKLGTWYATHIHTHSSEVWHLHPFTTPLHSHGVAQLIEIATNFSFIHLFFFFKKIW